MMSPHDSQRSVPPSGKTHVISTTDRPRLEGLVRDAAAGDSVARRWLRDLQAKLDAAEVCEPADVPPDVVTMNSTVCFRDVDTDEPETYTLVYPGFADSATRRLSVLTPIGIALLGCRVGEVAAWDDAFGGGRVRIESIDHQPESAGQYDL
jgi:regulator of nucleoside diphosphate kinase